MAEHLIEQARSIAAWTPPPMDMCAPRRISDFRSPILDRGENDNLRSRSAAVFIEPNSDQKFFGRQVG